MVISYNSQLGLRFKEPKVKLEFCKLIDNVLQKQLSLLKEKIDVLEGVKEDTFQGIHVELVNDINNELTQLKENRQIKENIDNAVSSTVEPLINDKGSSYYFICESVYNAASLIKVSTGFTGRTLKDINWGKYTYLMGKNSMVRFICVKDYIKGFYFDDLNQIAFEWGIEMETGNYFFEGIYSKEFSMIMQILTFVELGDIEVVELQGGRNNGGKKNVDKITNTSKNTVYVVDSTWNKIIIRTQWFAVRGHFKLQPCGAGLKDRKLIWINAFEKHGYTRRAKAEIVHH